MSIKETTEAKVSDQFGSDLVGDVLYRRTKIALGASGAVDGDLDAGQATMANSLPVVIASNQSAVDMDIAEKTLLYVSGTKTAAGDNELVAAPAAGNRIVVSSFVIQNEAATANTMILRSATTSVWRCFGQNQGDGLSKDFAAGREWKLAAAQALNLNLSAATVAGYSVAYYTEAV